VIEAITMDRRWYVGLDWRDCEMPPCSHGPLVVLRQRLLVLQTDHHRRERTVELAAPQRRLQLLAGGGGYGRIEDTYNLLGHAMRKA
jgi:hypothetical protein